MIAEAKTPTQPQTPAPPELSDQETGRPLVVDLDGSLIHTDTTYEAVALLLKHRAWSSLKLPAWLRGGRAKVKYELGQRVKLDASVLPYNQDVLAYAKQRKAAGDPVVLATAATQNHAQQVADAEPVAGLFDAVLASSESHNLTGNAKRDAVVDWVQTHTGQDHFDYIGDAEEDLPVWSAAGRAMMVDPSRWTQTRVRSHVPVLRQFEHPTDEWKALIRALRPQHWVKNLLVAVPMLLAHAVSAENLLSTLYAFITLSMTASGVYLLNDLMDLDSDRHHRIKRSRPMASGELPLRTGLILGLTLLPFAFVFAAITLPFAFLGPLFLYVLVTTAYSVLLKRKPILDVICLAGLYVLRVIAGGVALSIVPSGWTQAFCLFLFVSLAFLKRYAELDALRQREDPNADARGRGYRVQDLDMIRVLGPLSGYGAVVILCLFTISDAGQHGFNGHPEALWLIAIILLYWVSRTWLVAARQEVTEDPVIDALKDPHAWVAAAMTAGLLLIASLG